MVALRNGGIFRLPAYLAWFQTCLVALHVTPEMTHNAAQTAPTKMGAVAGIATGLLPQCAARVLRQFRDVVIQATAEISSMLGASPICRSCDPT